MKAPSKILFVSLFAVILFTALIFPAVFLRSESDAASSNQFMQQQQAAATSPEGAELYKQKCAICHDEPQDRVPRIGDSGRFGTEQSVIRGMTIPRNDDSEKR